jgi:hypothetical protein
MVVDDKPGGILAQQTSSAGSRPRSLGEMLAAEGGVESLWREQHGSVKCGPIRNQEWRTWPSPVK